MIKHAACQVMMIHPKYGSSPYSTLCGQLFSASEEKRVAKTYEELNCKFCQAEMAAVTKKIVNDVPQAP